MENANPSRPIIATMIGDPAGIGPEVCAKAIASGDPQKLCTPILIGDGIREMLDPKRVVSR